MPWVGDTPTRTDGTRTGPTVWQQASVAVETILSVDQDFHDQDMAGMVGDCINRNGANTVTADISWGSFKITNLGTAVNPNDGVNKAQMDAADATLQTNIDGKIGAVVEDTSPQLGGDLDVNGFDIVSVSNGSINLTADGTGKIALDSSGGEVVIQNINYPKLIGSSGDVLTSDGAASATFQTPAASPITQEFTSAEQTITTGGNVTVAHGLGVVPKIIQAYLICKIAENNWNIGDLMYIDQTQIYGGTLQSRGHTLSPDATNIYVVWGTSGGANVYEGMNKTTGARIAPTNVNWRLVIKAFA